MKYVALASASKSFWLAVFSGIAFFGFLGDLWSLAFKLEILDIVLVEKTEAESEIVTVLVVEDILCRCLVLVVRAVSCFVAALLIF